jgi:hypothetical protein
MLEIAVTVLAETRERTPMRKPARTLVVNAHGGLLKLRMELLAGQPLTLVDEKSGKQERAHVVRVEQSAADYFLVAFEFARPAPNFWPIVFPPGDWAVKTS